MNDGPDYDRCRPSQSGRWFRTPPCRRFGLVPGPGRVDVNDPPGRRLVQRYGAAWPSRLIVGSMTTTRASVERERECVVCGGSFSASWPNHRTVVCSPECDRQRKLKPPQERACAECGTIFVVSGLANKKVTCSPECAHERHKRAHREFARSKYVTRVNTRPLMKCPTCGQSFQPTRSHQKYCSRLCTQKGVDAQRERRPAERACRKCGAPVERKPGIPVCEDCLVEKRKRNQKKTERRRTLRTYGITSEQFDELLAVQDGRCAICGVTPGERAMAIDHDHRTGAVRGLLCGPCNSALGLFGDDRARLEAAVEYLTSHATPSS